VLVAITCDDRSHFNARQVAALVRRARRSLDIDNDRRLAEAVLALRPTRIEMALLFLEANSDQRWAIALSAQRAELGRRRLDAIATVARETLSRLEHAAMAGNMVDFSEQLGRAIGAPPELTKRIAEDPSGEPLAVTLIAMGAPNDVCVRILTAKDMHEGNEFRRLLPLTRLSKSMNPLAARRILSAMIGIAGTAIPEVAAPMSGSAPRSPSQRSGRNESTAATGHRIQPRNANTFGAR
jgi:hypothetical protein